MSTNTSKRDLQRVIENLKDKDIERELNEFSRNSNKVVRDLKTVTGNLSQREVEKGVREYGGAEQFLNAIVLYLAFKAALIRKGLQVSVAAGAGAVLFFGTGSLCHAVAGATGVAALDEIGSGIEMAGELAAEVSGAGLEVAAESAGFFGGLVDGVFSLFG